MTRQTGGRSRRAAVVLASLLAVLSQAGLRAGQGWMRPPAHILDVLHAPEPPSGWPSPTGEHLMLGTILRYPPIADLAAPMLPLAGVRIDPRTNGLQSETYVTGLSVLQVAGGVERRIGLPADARVILPILWSADGRRFAFTRRGTEAIELWTGESASAAARQVPGLMVNPVLGAGVGWMPDQRTLLVKTVPAGRGAPPGRPPAPDGPNVMEGSGQSARSTYEARDVLRTPHDEALFEHYTRSQISLVDASSGRATPIGEPGVYAQVEPSPDGRFLLVRRIRKPWSYAHAWNRFPHDLEVWDTSGRLVHVAASLPAAEQVPIHGVPVGPRGCSWRPTAPATLVWSEALDGGDPGKKVAHRDRLMALRAPFDGPAREIHRTAHRVASLWWGERNGLLLVREYERERRWTRTWAVAADEPAEAPRLLFDLSANDRYSDPGQPVLRVRPDGGQVLLQDGDDIFLAGEGAGPTGDRPFLDRFSLKGLRSERLFRSDAAGYERFGGWLDPRSGAFLTRRESPVDPPNFFVRTLAGRVRPAGAADASAPGRRPRSGQPAASARRKSAGEATAGKATAVETTAGKATVGEATVGKATAGEATAGKATAGTGEIPGGEAEWLSSARPLTAFVDPTPALRQITKRIVTYERADGTPQSFTLYLPPGYKEGTRLPTVLYAYPLEFSDPATAGQVGGSDREFTRLIGPTHLFFLLEGYAVLHNVAMPVIGDPDTAYDTFIEQLVSSARAAVDEAAKLGVTDPDRVGVMGHSHGALMTATLLAHSDIFRAGIARSGAYNHTLRPFGFQSERRTLWQAPQTYTRLSPLMHAPSINEPLLLIHGESDQNPGTVPLQTEKLFEAVLGTGGTARLVMLPHELHGYVSREAVEHVIAEQLAWFEKHVKTAALRPPAPRLAE